MKQTAVLFRKSEFYPDPVICAVFNYSNSLDTYQEIDRWKIRFVKKFPEFNNAEFTVEWVDVHSTENPV